MSRLDPGRAIGGESSRGDEKVGVRMILERARPGVEHREDAGRCADPCAVGGEPLDRSCGFAEQRGIDDGLV
jgi:hypothetical protein